MKLMLVQVMKYIYNISKKNTQLDDLYVFVNQYNIENLKLIDELVNNFKTVNIITSNLSKFKILERKYENENVLITVSNNKRKSAYRANLIVDIDFTKKDINGYKINNNAFIINLSNEETIIEKNFNGIIINNFNVDVNENELSYIKEFYGNINPKLFIESIIKSQIQGIQIETLRKCFEQNIIIVKELIGIRGVIDVKEIKNRNKNNMKTT